MKHSKDGLFVEESYSRKEAESNFLSIYFTVFHTGSEDLLIMNRCMRICAMKDTAIRIRLRQLFPIRFGTG